MYRVDKVRNNGSLMYGRDARRYYHSEATFRRYCGKLGPMKRMNYRTQEMNIIGTRKAYKLVSADPDVWEEIINPNECQ